MNEKITYDFNLSNSVSKHLEEIADDINKTIVKNLSEDEVLFSRSWNSETADQFFCKYRHLIHNYEILKDQLIYEVEQLNKISRHMFLIEQEAKKLAIENEQ